jgi:hypothetical protein
MRRGWLAVLIWFFSSGAWAEYSLQIGEDVRYQFSDNGITLHAVYPWNIRAGYVLDRWGFSFEHSELSEAPDGNETLSIRTHTSSNMLWVRRQLTQQGLFMGLGAGYYQDQVDTTFYGSTRTDYSKNTLWGAAEVGWQVFIVEPMTCEVEANFHLGDELNPAVQLGLGARVGVLF